MVANTDSVYFVITTYRLVCRHHRLKLPYSCNHSDAVRPDVISVALNSDSIGSKLYLHSPIDGCNDLEVSSRAASLCSSFCKTNVFR